MSSIRKRLVVMLVLILVFSALAGCAPPDKGATDGSGAGKRLVIAVGYEMGTMDIQNSREDTVAHALNGSSLLAYDLAN